MGDLDRRLRLPNFLRLNTHSEPEMTQQLLPIASLLLGSAFLLFAGGINGLILPVRGSIEGFSAFSLGLLGTGWAIGYIAGCVLVPRLVTRVGHIRSFSVMAAFAAFAILASLLALSPYAWIPLRALSGFCFAGAAMIVESWLNERSDAARRGIVFGTYTMINLAATTAGQLVIATGDPAGFAFFVIGAMSYVLALVPTAVSSSASPRPLVRSSLDVRELWKNSPVAVVAVVLIGVSNSAFGTMAAVYGTEIGLTITEIALFTSLPILAGAAAQLPVGYASDKMDRRIVLIAVATVAFLADLLFVLSRPEDRGLTLAAIAVFGACIYTMYPVIVAHASDHAEPDSFLRTSGGLLMLFGVGSIAGPLTAGALMSSVNSAGLFMTTAASHVAIVAYAAWRMTRRAAVAPKDKSPFVVAPIPRLATPQTMVLAPGVEPQASDYAPPESRPDDGDGPDRS